MDSSSTITPDKHGSETSQSVESSKPRTDGQSVPCKREVRRREHNDIEKKRKEQIKVCICRMGELLPQTYKTGERQSTLETVEKSLAYMRELKEARTKFSVIEEGLQEEVTCIKKERDKLLDIIKAAGLSTESIPSNGVSSTTDVKADSPQPTKHKDKKKRPHSTLSQTTVKDKQQQQEMISSSVSVSEDGASGIAGNQMLNMPPGAAFMNGQNMMYNQMMMQAGNQFMVPGMVGNGNQMVPNLGMIGSGMANMQQLPTPNALSDGSLNKSGDETDAGLLQLAMQDAGITPGSSSSATTPATLTPSIAETGHETDPSNAAQNNPLQTLASVATSTHQVTIESSGSDTQSNNNVVTSIAGLSNTNGQPGIQGVMQAGNNALINMPMFGNQPSIPGQQQMQQIMFINEQGIPIIANVPVGMDQNNPNMFSNGQKPGMMAQNQQVLKDGTGNMDQNALALAQQQANIAALQNQLIGQGPPGSNFPNNMQPFQQQGLIQGNLIQTPNGQILQQIGPQMQGQGQIIGMNGQGQGIVVAGQHGPVALNTMPSQPNQLPSALILPNGQIVPVVTNPGNGAGSQASITRMSGAQIQSGVDGQLISSGTGPGLLIPAASMGGQLTTSSTAASLSTSVIPTSAIQSVMTTQIQGSVQSQKVLNTTGAQTSVTTSSQQKLVGFPAAAAAAAAQNAANMVNVPPGSKSAPILISLPINGQATTVLLDPTTMQVLGTVQPGQQTPGVVTMGAQLPAAPVPVTSQTPAAQNAPNSTQAKKGKNNQNQRAICPKPQGNDGGKGQGSSSKKKKSSKAKSKEMVQPDSLSDSLQIQIPESTTDPETTSAISTESTDILAKAAESIFSSPNGEVSAVGGFYNPANEDNPLHIDTSVTENDDEKKSPVKQVNKSVKGPTINDNVLGLSSVAEGTVSVKVSRSKVATTASVSNSGVSGSVTSLSETLDDIASIQFSNAANTVSLSTPNKNRSEMDKGHKKGKNVVKTDAEKKDGAKNGKSGSKNKSGSNKKQIEITKTTVIEMEKMESDSQIELESTLIHIPDEISFSENDLSEMLDQVEQMDPGIDSVVKTPMASKKSKTKRSKANDSEIEPSAKKRKTGKDSAKDSVKESGVKESKDVKASRELLSMPTNLSVYDFDDSDHMVPSILPLNAKDFTNPQSNIQDNSSEIMDTSIQKNDKVKGNSQTSKAKLTVGNVKATKGGTNKPEGEIVEAVTNKGSVSEQSVNNTASLDNKKPPKNTKPETKTDLTMLNTVSLTPAVETETATSLFGFPVNKKQQKVVESVSRQNNSKTSSQLSPKPSPQPAAQILSPKTSLVSPKSQPSVSVSPAQNTAFSPEMVSPKLNIVSPGQGMMSDNEPISQVSPSPKNSPLKKRSPVGKMDNSLKPSSYSALNNVTEGGFSTAPNDKTCPPPVSPAFSQSGVITNMNTQNVSDLNVKPATSQSQPNPPPPQQQQQQQQSNNPVKVSEPSVVNNTGLTEKNNMAHPQNNTSNNLPNPNNQKQPLRNPTYTNLDNNTNNAPPPNITPNQRPVNTSVNNSVKSSQNNRYGQPYGNDPGFGHMPGINVNPSMSNESSQNCSNLGNFPPSFSSESLFNSQAEKVIKSPPNVNISTLNQQKTESNMLKMRNNPYTVDNFVESSRDDGMRPRPDSLNAPHQGMIGGELNNPSTDFSRLQNEGSDGFNFPHIGLNLPPITSTAGNYLENSSSGPANMPSSFSFSLSSTTSTVSTTSSSIGHHQFSFFPPILSSASNVPSSQSALPSSMPSMDMFEPGRPANDPVPRNMHPPNSGVPRNDNVPRPDKSHSAMSDDSTTDTANKPSCSKQKHPKAHGPATIQEPFTYNSSNSGGHDGSYFHEAQMKSNVGKSPTESMRKPADKPMDIGSSSRSSSQSSLPDKRVANMDRSPQMMNNPQPYYPSANFPSKSHNTNPLHHTMMHPDDRMRNITNRSPYENPFPPPPASQGFNNMAPNYSNNRFVDNAPPSFSRDNSGTQPLSHTPVNASGRKSANPPQSSVVKPPQKQTAPPLVPMGGQPSQNPRPTPPQSHRATTPHGNQSQAVPNPSQVNQSRQSKQPSRNSKPPSKKNKALPFMEVDSNLSNSIFEPNRSMTPFFPMQNLSPQSRAIQHEGPPFLSGNLFGSGPRFPNSNTPMPKNTDIGPPPFNPLFPGRGAQNSLGLGFQPGFGMNMNPLHGNHGNGPQLPHTAPHMANFSLNSIFTDGATQNESMSPIKFPHTNYQGMEHNPMQHHHQYNRGHPSVMSINSILGSNPHGFDGRMTTSMAGPFHSHGHPSLIPPFNFSMHDH